MSLILIAPDSAGSKGDEAMMRGVLEVFSGADITVLHTGNKCNGWRAELLRSCNDFSEVEVPFDEIDVGVTTPGTLIIVGADILDGTCGIRPALSRLKAASKMLSLGGEVHFFCSFRSEVAPEILDEIKELAPIEKIQWHLREETSLENFSRQTGLKADFFPDFAFFCPREKTALVEQLEKQIASAHKAGRKVIGINFSQPSCNSFFGEADDEKRREYVEDTLKILCESEPNALFALISHDRRHYSNHWSDDEFQKLAQTISPENCMLIPQGIGYPELQQLLPQLDSLVSGRMHLSVAAMRNGLVPIVFTGDDGGGKFTMAEKCRGMFENRIGHPEYVVTERSQLGATLQSVLQNQQSLQQLLTQKNASNQELERMAAAKLRAKMGLPETSVEKTEATVQEQLYYLRDVLRTTAMQTEVDDLQRQLREQAIEIERLNAILQQKPLKWLYRKKRS